MTRYSQIGLIDYLKLSYKMLGKGSFPDRIAFFNDKMVEFDVKKIAWILMKFWGDGAISNIEFSRYKATISIIS
jgi:hypothetical protein